MKEKNLETLGLERKFNKREPKECDNEDEEREIRVVTPSVLPGNGL